MVNIHEYDTQKHSRLQRYGCLNTSHFVVVGGGGWGGGGERALFVVLYSISPLLEQLLNLVMCSVAQCTAQIHVLA